MLDRETCNLHGEQIGWARETVGEVPGTPRRYHAGQPVPGALGAHVCGTAEDFAQGGVFDEANNGVYG